MKLPLIVCFLLFVNYGYGQQLQNTIDLAERVRLKYPVEKVHLHLDKIQYQTGETVWLKPYVVGAANRLSTLSKVLYVDLVNGNKEIITSIKLPLSNGLAAGNLVLPAMLTEGRYQIRAYTAWMCNFGEDSFFYQSIVVNGAESKPGGISTGLSSAQSASGHTRTEQNQPIKKNIPARTTRSSTNVVFFPEGGYLVDSIRSKVAFRAVDSNGQGVQVSGYVLDSNNARVGEFNGNHLGVGSFWLTPYYQDYTAIVKFPDGEKHFKLPAAQKQGYVLTLLSEQKGKILFRVTRSGNLASRQEELAIVAQSTEGTHFVYKFNLVKQFADIALPKADLPNGIVQLTLFDTNGSAAAERLVFIRGKEQLRLKLQADKEKYAPRDKVRMDLEVTDYSGQAVTGNFSVSVTDVSRIQDDQDERSNIFSDLLLRSELSSYIDSANYYFLDSSALRNADLDNLMLTQTWRGISFKPLEKRVIPSKVMYRPEAGLHISGVAFLKGKPLPNAKVTLLEPGAGFYLDTITNSDGRFIFDDLAFTDSMQFIIQAHTSKQDDIVELKMDQPAAPRAIPMSLDADDNTNLVITSLSESTAKSLPDKTVTTGKNVLAEVVVKATRNPKVVQNSSKLGMKEADYVFRPKDLAGNNIGLAIQNKVPGILITYDPVTRLTTAVMTRNKLLSGHPNMGMRVFLDGADYGYDLGQIDMNDVSSVEVFKGGNAIYGNKGFGGVIVVTSKLYSGEGYTNPAASTSIVKYPVVGYAVSKEFYPPDYSPGTAHNPAPDSLTTIYWKPMLLVNKNEHTRFEFHTADTPGKYRVTIEGTDDKGNIGSAAVELVVDVK